LPVLKKRAGYRVSGIGRSATMRRRCKLRCDERESKKKTKACAKPLQCKRLPGDPACLQRCGVVDWRIKEPLCIVITTPEA
jgi:hypothetical protein